jgi:hypothetical protein
VDVGAAQATTASAGIDSGMEWSCIISDAAAFTTTIAADAAAAATAAVGAASSAQASYTHRHHRLPLAGEHDAWGTDQTAQWAAQW